MNILLATHLGMFTYFEKVFIKKNPELINPVGFSFRANDDGGSSRCVCMYAHARNGGWVSAEGELRGKRVGTPVKYQFWLKSLSLGLIFLFDQYPHT